MVMIPGTAENVKQCICPGCPTFRESKLTGILFCAKGKAKETVSQKGCICPNCAVWKNYKLQDNYYCNMEKAV
jgi:hypothetical protein